MGLVGYYWWFVEGFSRIENTIRELQKKNNKFIWTDKCEEAFQKLKELLTTTPILRILDMDQDFLVCTDTSKEGLGGVFDAGRKSNKLCIKETQTPWRELYDPWFGFVRYSQRIWTHYLVCRKFELKTYHSGFQHIFTHSSLNARQRIWFDLLNDYYFEITYIKGIIKRVFDALSRYPCRFLVIPLRKNLRERILITTRWCLV